MEFLSVSYKSLVSFDAHSFLICMQKSTSQCLCWHVRNLQGKSYHITFVLICLSRIACELILKIGKLISSSSRSNKLIRDLFMEITLAYFPLWRTLWLVTCHSCYDNNKLFSHHLNQQDIKHFPMLNLRTIWIYDWE